MERTISGMMGKGSVNHNTRAFSAKNVDKERSRDNVDFCHEDIKAVYHELFDEALNGTMRSKNAVTGRLKTIMRKSGRGSRRNCFTK